MTIMLDVDQTLPKLPFPTSKILTVTLCAIVLAGFALIDDNAGYMVLAAFLFVLGNAAIVTLFVRKRERQNLVDLYVMRVCRLLGWERPERSRVRASRWVGGWLGYPRGLLLDYNPLHDEQLGEVIEEAQRLAGRAFKQPYKVLQIKQRSHRVILGVAGSEEERLVDERAQRIKSIAKKSFGAGSTIEITIDDHGEVRELSVTYEPVPRFASLAMRNRIEITVSAFLTGRWRAFWDLRHDSVRMERRPELSSLIMNPNKAPEMVDPRATYDSLTVPIGLDEDGNPVYWKPKDDPHGVVTGKTGKGKTVVLLGIAMHLAAHGWEVWAIDGKRIELVGLRGWKNVRMIAGRVDHQARLAHHIYTMMQQRFADYDAGKVRLEDFTPVLFLIDEFKTFKNALNRWYRQVKPRGGSTTPPVLDEISDFASLARKVRMHMIIGLQRPDAEFLSGDMRDNLGFRVSLGRLSPEGAKMMWGDFTTGVTIPIRSKGRGVAYNKVGDPVEVQTYWTPDPYITEPDRPEVWVFPEDLSIVQQLEPHEGLYPFMKIVDPQPAYSDDDKIAEPGYHDYMESVIIPLGDQAHELDRAAARLLYQPGTEVAPPALERLHRDAEDEDPEIDDEDELFTGFNDAEETLVETLLDDAGELAAEGTLILVDEDSNTWGLLDLAEIDIEDPDYITFSYRDFETGEPASISIPADNTITTRSPKTPDLQ